MSWDDISDSVCPIARSLAVVGDRWTLLIMRELSLGVHRFDDIQAQTGASSYLLSTRLKRLEKEGVLERRLYHQKPPRYEYYVTAKGQALDPILLMLRSWGMNFCAHSVDEEPAVKLTHIETGDEIDANWHIPKQDWPFTLDKVAGQLSPAFEKEREDKQRAFRRPAKKSEDSTQ